MQANFFSYLDSEGLIALKKNSKDPVITKIVRDHPDLREWEPWSETAEATEKAEATSANGGYAPKAVPVAATIRVEAVWKVDKKVGSIVEAIGESTEEYWSQPRCVEVMQRYADQKKLWKENNKKRFNLD